MQIAFGPVPSRRLGRSLGINNIPPKICSYACVYCQLGNTLKMEIERRAFYSPSEIYKSVEQRVKQVISKEEPIDYLAFVPDGEPTLDINLAKSIDLLKQLNIPIAIISNSSLIDREDVRSDLLKADWVSLKIDAGNKALWQKIDRPHGKLNFEQMLNGLYNFRENFNGILATETMLIDGLNDSEEAVYEISKILENLKADITYLSIPTRPPAEEHIQPARTETINAAYQIISSVVKKSELLTGYEGNAFSATGNIRQDILNITSVHPMREDAVKILLKKSQSGWNIIEQMLQEKEIIRLSYNKHDYYLRNLKKKKNKN
jgi:wyosine [tRNA(Phe)-imidazoG37] synthetase (radical SAM superfamily)